MKTFIFAVLLLSSTSSFAAGVSLSVIGPKAKALLSSLHSAGFMKDCGMGTCGLEVVNLKCLSLSNELEDLDYSCTFDVAEGSPATTTIEGHKAEKIFKALETIKLASDPLDTAGFGLLKDITCAEHGVQTRHPTYECTIVNADE